FLALKLAVASSLAQAKQRAAKGCDRWEPAVHVLLHEREQGRPGAERDEQAVERGRADPIASQQRERRREDLTLPNLCPHAHGQRGLLALAAVGEVARQPAQSA